MFIANGRPGLVFCIGQFDSRVIQVLPSQVSASPEPYLLIGHRHIAFSLLLFSYNARAIHFLLSEVSHHCGLGTKRNNTVSVPIQ